jgi:ferredoxin-NADP reductase
LAHVIAATLIAALKLTPARRTAEQDWLPRSGTPLAWPGLRALRVRTRAYEDEARSQSSFYLEPLDGLPLEPYRAGQFLTFPLDLPDTVRPVTRCYSLSDRHDPTAYRITRRSDD